MYITTGIQGLLEGLGKLLTGYHPGLSEEVQQTAVVEFSFLEVYNEKIHDLLCNSKLCTLAGEREQLAPGSTYKAAILAPEEHVVVRGLTRRRCEPGQLTQQVSSWLVEGAQSRIVNRTVFNPRSSRSHAATCHVSQKRPLEVATIHVCWNGAPEEQKKGVLS